MQAEVIMQLLAEMFIWWRKETFGTRVYIWLHGQYVGADEAGNRYYKARKGKRRWVVYNGYADPTTIPPGWHGWMHHRVDNLPDEDKYVPHFWEKPHKPNMTGTIAAYRPDSSLLARGERPKVSGDYDAWSPE